MPGSVLRAGARAGTRLVFRELERTEQITERNQINRVIIDGDKG